MNVTITRVHQGEPGGTVFVDVALTGEPLRIPGMGQDALRPTDGTLAFDPDGTFRWAEICGTAIWDGSPEDARSRGHVRVGPLGHVVLADAGPEVRALVDELRPHALEAAS